MDFSDLSSEYIGILYEGLLDYELQTRAPMTTRSSSSLSATSLLFRCSRLEAMDDADLQGLVEKMKTSRTAVSPGDDSAEDDERGR